VSAVSLAAVASAHLAKLRQDGAQQPDARQERVAVGLD
jgi:hypothetical protein